MEVVQPEGGWAELGHDGDVDHADDNLSDIFTKILGPNKFESLRDCMMVACNMPTPEELKAAAVVTPAANERRSTRRKRRPVHMSGS